MDGSNSLWKSDHLMVAKTCLVKAAYKTEVQEIPKSFYQW